jgi:hypothetical protein
MPANVESQVGANLDLEEQPLNQLDDGFSHFPRYPNQPLDYLGSPPDHRLNC